MLSLFTIRPRITEFAQEEEMSLEEIVFGYYYRNLGEQEAVAREYTQKYFDYLTPEREVPNENGG